MAEHLYENELLLSPLVREGLHQPDIQDFANAIEKVVDNMEQLRDATISPGKNIYDAVRAIDENVKK